MPTAGGNIGGVGTGRAVARRIVRIVGNAVTDVFYNVRLAGVRWQVRLEVRPAVPPGKAAEVIGMALNRFRERQRVTQAVENIREAHNLGIGGRTIHLDKGRALIFIWLP